MNAFFTDTLNISKINLCMLVHPQGTRLVHKNRPSHGLVLMLSGKTQYLFDDGSEMVVQAGELFYLPKFSSYRVNKIVKGDCIAVNFDIADEKITYPHFSLSEKNKIRYTVILKELLTAWGKRTSANMNICFAKLYELICAVQTEAMGRYLDTRAKQIALFGAEYISENLTRSDLTVTEMAEKLSISPEYFRKVFALVYGISPKKYIIMLRMEKAKELVASKELSINSISKLCGYEYECYFSRDFKKHVGVVPSKFELS